MFSFASTIDSITTFWGGITMKRLNVLLAMSLLAMGFVGCGTANNLREATDSYGYSHDYPSESENRYGYDGYGLGNNNFSYDGYGTGSYGYGDDYGMYGMYGNYNSYGGDLGYTGSTRGGTAYWDGYGINTGRDMGSMFDTSFDSNSMLN